MLKYVRFIHATKGEVFAFALAPLQHSDLAVMFGSQGYTPVSAANVSFDQEGTAHVYGESDSLQLKADMADARKIGAFYRSAAMINAMLPEVVPPLPPVRIESTPPSEEAKNDPFYSASVSCRP